MISSTEQQLSLITKKTERLEASLASQIEVMKHLKQEKEQAEHGVVQLREQLRAAEEGLATINQKFQEASGGLRQTATEYSKAQLLKKRYSNTLCSLQGFCKSVVRFRGKSDALVVADECTINAVERGKQFVFDCVLDDEHGNEDFGAHQIVADVVGGINSTVLTFGPNGGGKSTALWGPQSGVRGHASYTVEEEAKGIVPLFLRDLFASLEELEVTHFSMRCSFAEIYQDSMTDLLSDFSNIISSFVAPATDIRTVTIQTAQDATAALQLGLQRLEAARTKRRTRKSHVVFSMIIENFNTQGHYRKATVSFVDLCGSGNPNSGADQVWVNRSISSLCEVISMLSAAHGESKAPFAKNSRLLRVLGESLGGNCRTTMVCVVDTRQNSVDEVLSALTYAFHFKSVKNDPVPFDIPQELQKMQMEAGELEGQ